MEKSEGKRKLETEDDGVPKKQPRLGTEHETPAPEVAEPPPPVKQCDPLEHFVYELGDNLISRYIILSKIGEGKFSEVLECYDREAWECVAIKVATITRKSGARVYEANLLQQVAEIPEATSRIVQIRRWFEHEKRCCIVTERLGPNLCQFLVKNNCSPVPVQLVRIFGRQILEAVANVHRAKIIHTDLNLENIVLVSKNYVEHPDPASEMSQFRYWADPSAAIKLIDFGHAMTDKSRIRNKHCLPTVTARRYRAPEVVLGLDWTYPIDIWSVGCILATLCTGMPLFHMEDSDLDLEHLATMQRVLGDLPEDMTQRATQAFGTEWPGNWTEGAYSVDSVALVNSHLSLEDFVSLHVRSSDRAQLIDLLNGLLKYEPSERLTAKDALEHPFFNNPT